ncbi:hypothetical protein N8I71_16665 [Roseibacterium sp. SDUM158016]|uniref:hypothetical protein n=1 Tax=Roseicyclus sediminis TaxID=2980997 RepID=UPI0021CE467D|nr:hypothetical protein [Roseibacterium sp. SDUM158016]MCU4654474.1 hypothetical protein [Roseibacterium sp. SDUM158016]
MSDPAPDASLAPLSPDEIAALFTRADRQFLFARWGRPLAPVVFGVEDATVSTLKGAIEAVTALAGHRMTDTDPELGANLMVFFIRDWAELTETPGLDRLLPDLAGTVGRLASVDANQYRAFRFDADGGIKAAFVFVRMDAEMAQVPAETIALSQAVQTILLWSDTAFVGASPLAVLSEGGPAILKPQIADLIRAAYDPVLPVAATDPAHALRLAARLPRPQ